MEIIDVTRAELTDLAPLATDFRTALKSYRGITSQPDPAAGREELAEYLDAGYPLYAAREYGSAIGYLVCRVDAPCVWVESLYVAPAHRRQGVATLLLRKAETLAQSYGEPTLYFYVHPNNACMIDFLRRHGYTVLNLLEVRRPYPGETLTQKIPVGDQVFDY